MPNLMVALPKKMKKEEGKKLHGKNIYGLPIT